MFKLSPPESFLFERQSEWPEWKQRFMRYRTATKLSLEDGDVQVSALIYSMGKDAENIFKSFTFDNDDNRDNYEVVIQKFDEHFIPRRNDEYIRDRIMIGLKDKSLSEKLQPQETLMLTRAIEMARSHKLIKNQNVEQSESKLEETADLNEAGGGSINGLSPPLAMLNSNVTQAKRNTQKHQHCVVRATAVHVRIEPWEENGTVRFFTENRCTPRRNAQDAIKYIIRENTVLPKKLNVEKQSDLEDEVEAYIAEVKEHLPASPQKLHQIADATKAYEELQSMLKNVQQALPKHIKVVPVNLQAYFSQQGFLIESAGLLLHGSRIMIPIKMRDEVLACIHEGHQGLSKCREQAHLSVWWPGISADLKHKVNQCPLCQINKPTQRKESLLVTKLPPGPWRYLGVDLCEAGGHQYLVKVDYYLRFIEIAHLVDMTSRRVIGKLKSMFAHFGIPERLCSDNARQFTSVEFKTFAEQYGFVHVMSSPHFPQSNGEAERAVQTAKKMLKQDDPFLALLAYRATPIAATGCSPSQLLMGRHLPTTVPAVASNLVPEWPDLKRVEVKDRKAKESYRYFFYRRHGARSSPGDSVRLKLDGEKKWMTNGVVKSSS
ncbi:hypothetical protein H4Q32_008812 [Labeo rohita]|uniref:Gypsy retrotransposon integrase-like protein 1 n=1 Tax=Labeo rohita TaxID=84645 RepID=A0ABQ8M5K5_LABRO|nr:hypothetical protein H4Q32_008812 [Labeo rohita]